MSGRGGPMPPPPMPPGAASGASALRPMNGLLRGGLRCVGRHRQILKVELRDLRECGRGDDAAEDRRGGLVDDDEDDETRMRNRRQAAEGRDILPRRVAARPGLLRGAGLPGNAVTRDRGGVTGGAVLVDN